MDELLDAEWLGEMGDDMLLDRIGRGDDDRTVQDFDMPDEDWELEDLAHDWRDDVEDVPVPPKLDPDALTAEHERRKKAAEPSGPRTPTEGASQPMSTTAENMAHVRQQTTKVGEAAASVTHAMDLLRDAATQIGGVSGDLPGPNRAAAACTEAAGQLEQLQGLVMGLNNVIEEAAANPQAG
jgi:hypothetical protein